MNWYKKLLKPMEPTTKINNRLNEVGIIILVLAVLFAFCYFSNLSLILPVLLFFFGMYLVAFKKANFRMFLQLGFLLSLLLFGAHALLTYAGLSKFYIPVAAIAMLAMLLLMICSWVLLWHSYRVSSSL